MELLALVVVLLAEHFVRAGRYLRHDGWFVALQEWMDHHVLDYAMRYGCAVVAPAFLVAVIVLLAGDALWGIVGFVLHIVVLFYVLGRVQLADNVEGYLSDWRTMDLQGALHHAQEDFGVDVQAINNGAQLHRKMREQVLYIGMSGFFVTVFWYLVFSIIGLGIAGALIALLTRLYVQQASGEARLAVLPVLRVVEWLPSRLLGLTFAVAGNFGACFEQWVEHIAHAQMSNETFLADCGVSAIGVTDIVEEQPTDGELSRTYLARAEQEIRALVDLVKRSRYVWFAVVALTIVLGGF